MQQQNVQYILLVVVYVISQPLIIHNPLFLINLLLVIGLGLQEIRKG